MKEEELKKLLDAQAKAIADQLDERMDKPFSAQEKRLEKTLTGLERRLTENTDDQIARLFTHMNDRFDDLEERLGKRIDAVQTTVNGIAGHLDTFEQEQTIINHQVDGKLDQLAEATGIKWVTE